MKRYFYVLILLCSSIIGKSQIVNNEFENWTTGGSYDSLNYWTTDAFLVPACAQKELAVVQSGTTSLKLVTSIYNTSFSLPGAASTGGFAINGISIDLSKGGQPDSVRHASLKGYYAYAPSGGANGSIEVVLLKRNGAVRDTIAFGILPITTAQSSYIAFTVPLTFRQSGKPDTSIVYFQSSGRTISDAFNTATVGSTLLIDSIYFDGVTGINELPSNLISVSAYPNPASDYLVIESAWKTTTRGSVAVLDISGKMLKSTPITDDKQRIDVNGLVNGNYFYELLDDKGAKLYSGKFSVSH